MSYKKGFKVFNLTENGELVCRDFVFKEGETYEIEGELKLGENGFHFCKDLVLTLQYYPDCENNVYAEVEALGEVEYEQPTKHKAATTKLKVCRVLSKEEVLEMLDGNWNSGNWNSGNLNSGNRNSGNRNSGNRNSGDWNSGNRNSGNRNSGDRNNGNRNSGDWNSGHWNSGHWNSGDRNSGDRNSGHWNSGDWNSGHWNSGNWNSCDNESGFFNSAQPETIRVFNKPCLVSVWESAKKPDFLYFNLIEGKTYKESFQIAYEKATNEEKDLLKSLPNFDADVFFEISGIRVN